MLVFFFQLNLGSVVVNFEIRQVQCWFIVPLATELLNFCKIFTWFQKADVDVSTVDLTGVITLDTAVNVSFVNAF